MSCRERPRPAKSLDSKQCSDSRKEQESIRRKKKEDRQKPRHAEEKPSVKETTKEKGKRLTREQSREQQMPPEKTKTTRSMSVKTPLPRHLEPSSLPRDLEPSSLPRDLEPSSLHRDLEPPSLPRDLEPSSLHRDLEPPSLPRDLEPSSLHRDLEPPSLHRDLESQATAMRSETPKEVTKASKPSKPSTKPKTGGKAQTLTHCTKAPGKIEGAQLKEKTLERPLEKKTEAAAEKSYDTESVVGLKPKMLKTRSVSEDSVLRSTLGKLKIKAKDKSDTCKVVNDFIENLIRYLKKETIYFQEVDEPLRTGSYYEHLKILDPDEFDVMLPMPVERVQIDPFGENGAFYSVALKRGNNPLMKFQQNDILSASEMLQEFRKEVKKFAKRFPAWTIEKKKGGCPAVTLTHGVGSVIISLDVVLCLHVKSSWPSFTSGGLKIDQWLGTKVKQDYKRKPYYLVPKYEGRGNVENDGVLNKDVWRISFSHIEKDIIKKHGSQKTCCEKEGANCCRKDCLKLLKHLLHLLKESNSSFAKFCSYHAKTTLLHACCSRNSDTDWGASDLNRCFSLLLQDFESHLRRAELYNFFIPSQNLLSDPGKKRCKDLADCIKEQRENGFPIFARDL